MNKVLLLSSSQEREATLISSVTNSGSKRSWPSGRKDFFEGQNDLLLRRLWGLLRPQRKLPPEG